MTIGDDPHVTRFLRAGAACMGWPAVQAACLPITLAFQISLNVEPDLALLHRPLVHENRMCSTRKGVR